MNTLELKFDDLININSSLSPLMEIDINMSLTEPTSSKIQAIWRL